MPYTDDLDHKDGGDDADDYVTHGDHPAIQHDALRILHTHGEIHSNTDTHPEPYVHAHQHSHAGYTHAHPHTHGDGHSPHHDANDHAYRDADETGHEYQ